MGLWNTNGEALIDFAAIALCNGLGEEMFQRAQKVACGFSALGTLPCIIGSDLVEVLTFPGSTGLLLWSGQKCGPISSQPPISLNCFVLQ